MDTVPCEVCGAEVETVNMPNHFEWHEKIARATIMTATNMEIINDFMSTLRDIGEQLRNFALENSAI